MEQLSLPPEVCKKCTVGCGLSQGIPEKSGEAITREAVWSEVLRSLLYVRGMLEQVQGVSMEMWTAPFN